MAIDVANARQMRLGLGALITVLILWLGSAAEAQTCAQELRALYDLHDRMRAEVMADHAAAAVQIWSRHKLEQPPGFAFDASVACQSWFREVGNDYRFGCSLERAHDQFVDLQTRQSVAPSPVDVRAALQEVARRASVELSCRGKDELYLICQPTSEAFPDAWCARRVDSRATLEFPRDGSCKVVDGDGSELASVVEGPELTCSDDSKAYVTAETRRVRAERRGSVAAAGTFIALMSAFAIPASFVPEGTARLLRRLHVLHQSDDARLRHHSFRARQRVLPLIGMTALSVSALSSRYWWAGVLTASCGVTSDVMLAEYWQRGGSARRGIGIATATVGSVAGLLLDLETLAYSDLGGSNAFMPTLRVGVAQVELGLAGRF